MTFEDAIDAFRPEIEALERAKERRNRGATRGRLMPTVDEVRVVNAGEFFQRWCMIMAPIIIEMGAVIDEFQRRSDEAMGIYTEEGDRE